MKSYIALFRGINVGGAHILPMKELVSLLEKLGCESVRTYIQSGNAVFRHKAAAAGLAEKIRAAIEAAKGFEPEVMLLSSAELARARASNPFKQAEDDASKLQLYFLAAKPKKPDMKLLESLCASDERFHLTERVFYLYAPSGIGRSKLAAKVDRALGVASTARNWRTLEKVQELAQASE